ncbi:unnamed protein product [Schistocephalus solidus]|uniref:PHB domain-containing protein n=1 Tax=Schistocephalus solidus TaxID=70667 RepID=A0A183TK97_SCHSO|nr:unnamed protein product [Schistocephalus solidus]
MPRHGGVTEAASSFQDVNAWDPVLPLRLQYFPEAAEVHVLIFLHGLSPSPYGFVVLLPFVDQYHLIDLDDQHVDVKPVSGGTVDEAIVEVGCRVFFRIIDPEAAISRMSKRPDEVLIRKTQSSLLSALSRVKWADLTSGHVTTDVACAVRVSRRRTWHQDRA